MPKPNLKQQECINNIKGKYLVLAGPGTGKTFTVIKRIKNMLDKGIDPKKILCLTFSDSAAKEMQERLARELKSAKINVNIFTYHSFCFDIIENYNDDFDLGENIKIMTEPSSRALIKECIDEINPKYLRNDKNDPYAYISKIKDRINEIKQNRLTKEQFDYNLENNQDWLPELKKITSEIEEKHAKGNTRTLTLEKKQEETKKKIEQIQELWQFYELYQEKMEKYHFIDFNDMISLVLDKFDKNPSFLEKIAKQYEYILVDEYQDTNKSQNDIVFNLASCSENIFVVGDDDQIIYSFQGAKLNTIENYLEHFPDTKVICLSENMRSTQNILDVSRALAEQDSNRLEVNPRFGKYKIDKKLVSKNQKLVCKNFKVKLNKYQNILEEYVEIINEIEKIINSDELVLNEKGEKDLSEIAILTRSNAELEKFSEMLKERNIPYELKEGKNIFQISATVVLYYYAKALCAIDLYSDKLFKLLLNPPFNLNSKDYETIFKNSTKQKSIIDAIKEVPDEFIEKEKIENFVKTFEYLKEYKNCESLKNVILEIGSKTGIFEYYLNQKINRSNNIAAIKKLVDEATSFCEIKKAATLEDFIEYLDISINDEIDIKTDKAPYPLNAVQLSTYYSAKGREFDFVFMPTLTDRKWEKGKGNKANIPLAPQEYKDEEKLAKEKISDRIKVMYVGMTRARHSLYLSYPADKTLSNFIVNIQDMLEIKETCETTIEEFWDNIKKTITKKDYDYIKDFSSYIDSIIGDCAYSASALNTYLFCPQKYLYEKVLKLSAKDGNCDALSYGSAVHKAFEAAISYAIKNQVHIDKNDFIEEFKKALNKLPMSTYEQRQIHLERGQKELSCYYSKLIETPTSCFEGCEKEFHFELDNIKFIGFIDRIDKNSDGTYTIYDYKTGSPKTKSSIAPEKDHEDYYNQMAFYKFALEKVTGKKVKDTVFIFPIAPSKNLCLELNDDDIQAVVEKYKTAVENIKNHNFEKSKKRSGEYCKYCQYRDFCSLDVV